MKKYLAILFASILCGVSVFTGCSNSTQEKTDEPAETEAIQSESTEESTKAGTAQTEAAQAEVSQEDIEANIIGTWILAECDGKPVLTNEKSVLVFPSITKAYISTSLNSRPDAGDTFECTL